MAYGFQQYDSAGNIIVDSSAPVQTISQIATGLSVTLYPPNVASGSQPNTFNYNLTGVTSQADLEDNYVFLRTDAGGWNVFVAETNHALTYVSAGVVRFTWAGSCVGFFGGSRTCTAFDAIANTYDVYAIGKAL